MPKKCLSSVLTRYYRWCIVRFVRNGEAQMFANTRSGGANTEEGTTMGYHTECHVCGEKVLLHEATEKETEDAGYDYAPGEYLIGRCRKRFHDDGTRTHYSQQTVVVHASDAKAGE